MFSSFNPPQKKTYVVITRDKVPYIHLRNNMKNYEEHIVAFLDILGFKYIIDHSSFEDVIKIFSAVTGGDNLTELRMKLERYDQTVSEEEKNKKTEIDNYRKAIDTIKTYIMSDSIVIASTADNPESLAIVLDMCFLIQYQLLNLNTPVIIRGALAKGDFYIGDGEDTKKKSGNNTLVFGKGLISAYLAQEKYAVVPRVIVSKEILSTYTASIYGDQLSEDPEDGYMYQSVLRHYLFESINEDICKKKNEDEINFYKKVFRGTERYKKIKKLIDDNLCGYNDIGIRKKYLWLDAEVKRVENQYLNLHGIFTNGNMSYIKKAIQFR